MSKKFKRQNSHKKKQTPSSWRSPEGHHSNVRKGKKGAANKPNVGYRNSKETRDKHPSGFDEVMVHNTDDLKEIDSETEAARIAGKIGGKKRAAIIEKADEMDVKILNRGEE